MQNLQEELIDLLKDEENLVVDGQLNKTKIVEAVLTVKPEFLKLLINNKTFKKHFFQDIDGVLVFDKIAFQRFVNNKSFLPDSYTAFKNKIGLTINDGTTDNYISSRNDISLVWPHKDGVLEGGQTKEDQKRDEIFWNETLAPDNVDRLLSPKALTNFKKYTANGEEKIQEFNGDDNLLIRGNNLLGLASLLATHRGKIKLVYIDPPYGKDADTFYNDSFKKSTWLTFMKNRLEIAKKLLKPDGIIFLQISYHSYSELKLLCDEIFEKNHLNTIIVKVRSTSGFKVVNSGCFVSSEFIVSYYKGNKKPNTKKLYVEADYDPAYNKYVPNRERDYKEWEILSTKESTAIEHGYETYRKLKKDLGQKQAENLLAEFALKNADKVCQLESIGDAAGKDTLALKKKSKKERDEVFFVENSNGDHRYIYNGREMAFYKKKLREIDGVMVPTTLLTDIWTDISWEGIGNEGGVTLNRGKKPEKLIQRILDLTTDEGDFVLDFHLGSGTTAAVAKKMNRKFIGIEQLDYGKDDPVNRLINVLNGDQTGISDSVSWKGGGTFVYAELMQYNQIFLEKIQSALTKDNLIEIWKEMEVSAFLHYQFDKSAFNDRLKAFQTAPLEDMKIFLVEVLDKNQLYVNYSEIEDKTYNVNKEDLFLNRKFYNQK